MIVPENFNTNIDSLIELINDETIFLSSWDKSEPELEFPDEIIEKALEESKNYKNRYAFSDEFDSLKPVYFLNATKNNYPKNNKKISLLSNGTSTILLTLYSLKERLGELKVLLVTPVYYTYIKILLKMKVETHFVQVDLNNDLSLPIDEIKKSIINNKINLLILNDPLFGTGISVKENEYLKLNEICHDLNCNILIDYIYGGMEWNKPAKILNEFLLPLCINNEHMILLESISKRVFLNGVKNAIIIANEDMINIIEKNSVYLVGSMAFLQVNMFKQLYSKENNDTIISLINKNIECCKNNYDILHNLLSYSNIKLLKCDSSCFCLIGIPISFKRQTSTDVSKEIFAKSNILLIPHDRYLLFSDKYFRINLLIRQDNLIKGILKLKEIFDN